MRMRARHTHIAQAQTSPYCAARLIPEGLPMRAFAQLSLVSLSVLAVTYLGCGASSDKTGDEFTPAGSNGDDGGGGGGDDETGGLGGDVGGLGGDGGGPGFDLTIDPINA